MYQLADMVAISSATGSGLPVSSEPPLTAAIQKFTSPAVMRFGLKHRLVQRISYTEVLHATPLFGIIAAAIVTIKSNAFAPGACGNGYTCSRRHTVWREGQSTMPLIGLSINACATRNPKRWLPCATLWETRTGNGRQELAANLHVLFRLLRPPSFAEPKAPSRGVVL